MKELSEETKRRLRAVRAALIAAVCECDGKHDPFWAKCPRMLAGCEFDNVMAIVRQELAIKD